MELTGKILELQDEKIISPKFRKRSMILETTEDKFPQPVEIEFTQDRGALLDKCRLGQQVLVSFNLRGRKWTSARGEVRYFTSVQGWRIQDANAGGGGGGGGGGGFPAPSSDDDIPF